MRAGTTLALEDGADPLRLWAVTSLATGAVVSGAVADADVDVWSAESGQMAENRCQATLLQSRGLAGLRGPARGETTRGRLARVGTSTWSTGLHITAGAATVQARMLRIRGAAPSFPRQGPRSHCDLRLQAS